MLDGSDFKNMQFKTEKSASSGELEFGNDDDNLVKDVNVEFIDDT